MSEDILADRQAARIVEPIYRMHKVVQQKDGDDARTLMALCVQYITENSVGECLTDADVQSIVRRALLYYKNGCYYADYIFNERDVKVANWRTLLAGDRPVTLEQLGGAADRLADFLADKNAGELSVQDVLDRVKDLTADLDDIVYQRLLLNEAVFSKELAALLVK